MASKKFTWPVDSFLYRSPGQVSEKVNLQPWLQTKAMDVSFCKRTVERLMDTIEELKSEEAFERIFSRAANITEDPELMHI